MKRRARLGQATVEFAIVFLVLSLVLFGAIEAARAVYEKDALTRAAEAIVQDLAEADPRGPNPFPTSASVSAAIADANQKAGLGLATGWTSPTTSGSHYYNSANRDCETVVYDSPQMPCDSKPNADGTVIIVGFPDLGQPATVRVTIKIPYRSYLEYPLQFLGGQAIETVAATTLTGQIPSP
jgi:Flp pilus assembly protein TadG